MIGTKTRKYRLLCLLLAALVCAAGFVLPGVSASAAETPTSLGLAAHGIKAHRDGWKYEGGSKGRTDSSGTRYSDCAGLLYAYFSDVGALGNCQGGATSQVNSNCVFSNDISEGIPNIHGLALTMPDYNDPGTGIYGHIGIYIGNNEAADNSDYEHNMRRETVVGNSGRNWNAWHVFDNGMRYPVNGWYALDGKLVHYTNYEYDTDTVVDGYFINEEGYAEMPGGTFYPVDSSILSNEYASASQVAAYLRTKYSGKDSTYELIYGGSGSAGTEPEYNGTLTGDGVRLRASATTTAAVVDTLSKGAFLNILSEETGEKVSHNGQSTDVWYMVTTASGKSGYICSLFAKRLPVPALSAPVISASNGYVTMTTQSSSANIYYTTDGTEPTEKDGMVYTSPLFLVGQTYKAVASQNGRKSGVTTATVLSNSAVFTDFTSKDWYFTAVDKAVAASIFHGNGDGTFSPNQKITRAQFVMALANLDRVDLEQYAVDSGFSDVSGTSQMDKAVTWAVKTGIVSGYSDGTFRPSAPISREQMCVILANYTGVERSDASSAFADDWKISSWAKDAVYACRDNGLISGIGENKFDPQGTTTRAQACVVTVNFYEK